MGRNFDYPMPRRGRMAKTYLRQLSEDASGLNRVLRDDDTLPAWVEYYIASSADRVNTLSRYMQYQVSEFRPSSQFQVVRSNPSEGLEFVSALIPQVLDVATLKTRTKHEQAMGKITGKTERFLSSEESKRAAILAQGEAEAEATKRSIIMWGFGSAVVIGLAALFAFRKK